jgi:hypothetical protein
MAENPAIHWVKCEESLKPRPKDDRVFANTPYLARFGQDSPHEWLSAVFSYLGRYVIIQSHRIHLLSEVKNVEEDLRSDKERLHRLSRLIRDADTGILALRLSDEPGQTSSMPALCPPEDSFSRANPTSGLLAAHAYYRSGLETNTQKDLFFSEESTGTQQLLVLGNKILPVLENGGVIIVDEWTNNLHFSLSQFLVSLFQDELSNPHNAQLIVTAHDPSLLRDHFRKDQVWFADKNNNGATRLHSAFDFRDVRDDTNLELWYRTGKFGAKPHIKAMQFVHGTAK